MANGQERVQKKTETWSAQKWRDTQAKLQIEREQHKVTKQDLSTAQDFVAALTQENLELSKLVKDYQARFDNGGVAYTINDGYVSNAVVIPPYSEWTYTQDIPKEIGLPLYNRIPFVKVEDRAFTIDTKQKLNYERIRLL